LNWKNKNGVVFMNADSNRPPTGMNSKGDFSMFHAYPPRKVPAVIIVRNENKFINKRGFF